MSDDDAEATLSAFGKEALRMRQELHQTALQHQALEQECKVARENWAKLQQEFHVLTSGTQAMFLYIEKQRAVHMGWWWWLIVLATLVSAAALIQRESYAWAALNFLSFLGVWRGLYVERNRETLFAAVTVMVLTIYFS
jgi:hypothetical protein